MNKLKTLVIGSKNHKDADKSVDWLEPKNYYVGDYDLIIIDTTSLTENILEKAKNTSNENLSIIRKEILDMLIDQLPKTIICIASPYIQGQTFSVAYGGKSTPEFSNFNWCPIEFILQGKPITNLKEVTKFLDYYFEKVKKSDYHFDYDHNINWLSEQKSANLEWSYITDSFVTDNVGKPIGFSISLDITLPNKKPYRPSNSLIFIPPTTTISTKEGINLLIREINGLKEDILIPDWANNIYLPGQKELLLENKENEGKITNIQAKINEKSTKLRALDQFKILLYGEGKELEDIVEKSLKMLGIEVKKPEIDNIEDRYFQENEVKIPVEIKSCDKCANNRHIGQLLTRVDSYEKSEYKTRGLLIINTFHETFPNKRKDAFQESIIKIAKDANLTLMTTKDLFDLVCKKLNGEKLSTIKADIFNTIGIFK